MQIFRKKQHYQNKDSLKENNKNAYILKQKAIKTKTQT